MIIGIDPSLTGTGIAADGSLVTVRDKAVAGDGRLQLVYDAVTTVCGGEAVQLAVIEDLPIHAHAAGKTGMVQGVVRLALLHADVRYVLVTPSTLKKFATGSGNAAKPELRMSLYKRTGIDLPDDNQVDAWWLRQIGLHMTHQPDAMRLPKTHAIALSKINTDPAGAA